LAESFGILKEDVYIWQKKQMRYDLFIDLFALIIFLGAFQGCFISLFFLTKNNARKMANVYMGLFVLALALVISEGFLNYSGFIVRVIALSNFAEPLNFAMAPLFFMYLKRRLANKREAKDLWHFAMFGFWLLYCGFHFAQSDAFKYNSYVYSLHPSWERLPVVSKFSEDPLGLRHWLNEMTLTHFVLYMFLGGKLLFREAARLKESLWRPTNATLKQLRNSTIHVNVIVFIFVFVKVYYGRDLGDYFISAYVSFLIFITSYQIIRVSSFFEQPILMDITSLKYRKSSLDTVRKQDILARIEKEMQGKAFYVSNTASLSKLARLVGESQHHVSQVINEQLGKSFFELLATYRVDEAKTILVSKEGRGLTIEEVAERVGYNSKSAFNAAFKKYTSSTPSGFRGESFVHNHKDR